MRFQQKNQSLKTQIFNKYKSKKGIDRIIKHSSIYLLVGLATLEVLTILAITTNYESILVSEYKSFKSINRINSLYEPFQYVLSATIIYLITRLKISRNIKYILSSFWLTILTLDLYKIHLKVETNMNEIIFNWKINHGTILGINTAWRAGIIITIALFMVILTKKLLNRLEDTRSKEIIRVNIYIATSLLFFGVGIDALGGNSNLNKDAIYLIEFIEELGEFATITLAFIYHFRQRYK